MYVELAFKVGLQTYPGLEAEMKHAIYVLKPGTLLRSP